MQRKRLEENRGTYMFVTLVVLCAGLYLVFNIIDAWHKYQESNRRLETSQASLVQLQNQLSDLKKQQAHASSTTGVETQLRSKFNLAKPNEKAVFITSEEVAPPPPEEKGIQKILSQFKKFFN